MSAAADVLATLDALELLIFQETARARLHKELWILRRQILPNLHGLKRVAVMRMLEVMEPVPRETGK